MIINKIKVLAVVVISILLIACSPGMSMNQKSNDEDTKVILITPKLVEKMNVNHINKPIYLIGEQDRLRIKVWGDVNLNTSSNPTQIDDSSLEDLVVQNNGTIFYPYIGNIVVVGKSIEQIRKLVTKKLKKYITDPQVSVIVSKYKSKKVYIMGEVKNPDTYVINDTPMSLLDLMMLGNINQITADTEQIFVIRRLKKNSNTTIKPIVYRFNGGSADTMILAGHFYLKEKDVVFIAPVGVVSWNRVISNIFPTTNLGAQVNSINK